MYFRSILSGTLAALLLSGAAYARDISTTAAPATTGNHGIAVPMPKSGLPGVFSGQQAGLIQVAQASDPRVQTLEEQVRTLNGTIEELNFQVLQMQEQLRKMQEDNEFRFQELENKKKSDAGSGHTNRSVADNSAASSAQQPLASSAGQAAGSSSTSVGEIITENGGQQTATGSPGKGLPPKSFGTITFDANGNVKSGSIGDAASAEAIPADNNTAPASNGAVVAALPETNSPDELYRNSYQFILSGDYGTAETGFRQHIERFPNDPKTPDSHFWLGEALLGQQKYRDAAETFLAANKAYPKSKKAPEMLLKLGISLVGLNQRDVACATFNEIGKRYPDITSALKDRVKQEQARSAC
jgi:tol-pal system protein YbgF